jgi:8-oxo-dGTP pyrophosphatase MutT (NUDIX family)
VLLIPAHDGSASVILTERVDRGGHHSGEVSFPGGRSEPGDASMAATALREAAEEVALDARAAGVEVIAELETFWIPVSDFRVTPVVAVARNRPLLSPSPDEVARILEAPLAAFLPGAPIEIVEREIRGWQIRYGAYAIDGLLVWGATARVLGQLGAILGT